ncbi:MAG: alpha/beta hydrolase [Pseudobacteriovorax sp.]|nr:alpha/beta hydrolase [Pseudobacteriovorax sp.]
MRRDHGIVNKAIDLIPDRIKAKAGAKAYEGFINLRRRVLNARCLMAEISGGRKIEYLEIDNGHEETLMFLHGFADSKDTFYDASQFLSQKFNLIIPDLPGFGRSFKRRHDRHNLDYFGKAMGEFVEKIELYDFHLSGNSLGGAISVKTYLEVPDRIKSLSLVDPGGIYVKEPRNLHHELFDNHIIFDIKNRDDFEYFLNRVFSKHPLMPHPIKDHIFHEMMRHRLWHRKLLADLFSGMGSEDDPKLLDFALNNCLKEIECPTLILWGDDDTLFPKETAYVIKKEIPNSEIHFLLDVGHAPQIESPRRFAKVLTKFIESQNLKYFLAENQETKKLVNSMES